MSHVRFRVRGVPVDDREIIKSVEAPVVRDSPRVKPVRSGNYLETPTPSRSPPIGEEFHGPPVPSLFSESHRKDDCDGAVEQLSHTGPDILDEMIKQTRVEKELVSENRTPFSHCLS